MTQAAVTGIVSAGTSFGIAQYPQAVPGVRIGRAVICSAANSTNIQPQQVVDALNTAGVTNQYAMLIVNGSLAVYDTLFASYGAGWVNNQAALKGYLSAVCAGLNQALGQAIILERRRQIGIRRLPPHLHTE
jgi:hypothetical protein